MDYKIGSVADIISGKSSLTKRKKEIHRNGVTSKAPSKKARLEETKKKMINTVQKEAKTLKNVKKVEEDDEDENSSEDEISNEDQTFSEDETSSDDETSSEDDPSSEDEISSEDENENINDDEKDNQGNVENDDDDDENIELPDVSDECNSDSDDNEKEEQKKKKLTPEELAEQNKRTIFVGNVPMNVKKRQLIKFFKKYGAVESVRLRSVPISDIGIPKKVAIIKKEFHPNRSSLNSYVRFVSESDAKKALAANGAEFKGYHIRVNMSENSQKTENGKAIFVGNLKFDVEEEELWKTFELCGEISSVRLIRDYKTNVGKGFGYVNFTSSDAVELALQMENVKLKGRDLRIFPYKDSAKKTKPKKTISNKDAYLRRYSKKGNIDNEKLNSPTKTTGNSNGKTNKSVFQGKKFTDTKKKYKINKGLAQKKKFAKKLLSK